MWLSLTLSHLLPALTLDDVYERVSRLRGVRIVAGMVRPSVVPMEFRIARGGQMWAKYPTSEMFIGLDQQVTWMPDRRQYARSKPEPGTPVPAGFESLWPNGQRLTTSVPGARTTFMGRPVEKFTCHAPQGHSVELYVDPKTLLPLGTVATLGATTYEMRYNSVNEAAYTLSDLKFKAPKDAVPATSEDPSTRMVKPGTLLPSFEGVTTSGQRLALSTLSKRYPRGLVLNFWFSSCTGCIQELPFLRQQSKLWSKSGIGVIGINPIDDPKSAAKTAKLHGLPYPTLIGSTARSLAKRAGVTAYPVTVVIDGKGRVIDAIMGFDESRLTRAIGRVTAEK